VKKIISILVALGLVLGLSVIATPVAAQVTTPAVALSGTDAYCACNNATYTITFNISASLTQGVHQICVEFPAGTTIPAAATFATGDITVNGNDVFAGEVTVTGTKVCFLVPVSFEVADNPIVVVFTAGAGIKNPCTPGPYTLKVSTSRAPDSTAVASDIYTILPALSVYEYLMDFSPTYANINPAFIPPFKACGQADHSLYYDPVAGGYMEAFNLTFHAKTVGCDTPCDNVTLSFGVKSAPAGGVITLNISGVGYFQVTSANTSVNLTTIIGLATDELDVWPSSIHFNLPGNYTICFYAVCPTAPVCLPPGSETIVTSCFPFQVYQWKDAISFNLTRKWNLISLPLVPFDTNINNILAALPPKVKADIIGIWNYSGGAWSNWPSPGTLTTMVDGKAYWIRTFYNATLPMGSNLGQLWVFGTAKPVPPNAPSAYPVVAGWNMVGFTELPSAPGWPFRDDAYLWNFVPSTGYGAVYGWNAGSQAWDTPVAPASVWMASGKGYWISFAVPGTIYPP
jgi:hypothetical protein